MPTLTTTQLNSAAAYLGTSYATSDIEGYYTYLRSQGISYGDLALGVVLNNTLDGQVANDYADSVAAGKNVDFSVGSTNWQNTIYDIANRDYDKRVANSGADLSWRDYDAIHSQAFNDIGLPSETWTSHTPLTHQDQISSSAADAEWNAILANHGNIVADVYNGLGIVLSGSVIDPNLSFSDYLKAVGESAAWNAHLADALGTLTLSELESLIDPVAHPGFWTDFNALKDFLGDHPGANVGAPAHWIEGNWGFAAPQEPGWVQGVGTIWGLSEQVSPLVLDLAGTGLSLSAVHTTGSIYWDINQDGNYVEETGWIAAGTGLLAIDLNSDGIINNSSELFGDQPAGGSPNGFATLLIYDTNTDHHITSADTQFGDLVVWTDDNHDGSTQSGELHTLSSLGITDINLYYSNTNYNIAGNNIKQESTFTINGDTHTIADAWFAIDPTNSHYYADYTLNIETLFLPDLRGYGEMPDLHIAMSGDSTLLDMMGDIAATDAATFFDPSYGAFGQMTELLYQWAGLESVDPDSRGGFIDARKVEFLEEMMVAHYKFGGDGFSPLEQASPIVENAFLLELYSTTGAVAAQKFGSDMFDSEPTFSTATGAFSGATELNLTGISDLVTGLDLHGESLMNAWIILFSAIDQVIGLDNLSSGDQSGLASLVFDIADPMGLTFDQLKLEITVPNTGGSPSFVGDANDNILQGFSSVNPSIVGNGGDDILIGGSTMNYLHGNAGDDTYVFQAGDSSNTATTGYGDQAYENAIQGTDTLFFDGINPEDIRMWNDGTGNNVLQYSGTDLVYLNSVGDSQSSYNDLASYFEKIAFSDGTVWNLGDGLHITDIDTGHTLTGSLEADLLDGRGGNDNIYGYAGDDMIAGGTGNDHLVGGSGNDTYYFVPGDGTDNVTELLSGGTDTIGLTDYGVTDIRLWGDGSGDLIIQSKLSSSDTITLIGGTTSAGDLDIGNYFESIVFGDTTTWSLTGGLHMEGGTGNDTISGTGYSDLIFGASGDDNMSGGAGNDTLSGGSGHDYLNGGSGHDTADYSHAAAGVAVYLTYGVTTNDGDGSYDGLWSIENLIGSAYNDILDADDNANVINGGGGTNTLYGEGGAYTFVFDSITATNNVQDFSTAQGDKLDVSHLLETYDPLTDAITDFVQITTSGSNSLLSVDTDGNGSAHSFQQIATLYGITGLTDEAALVTAGTLIV